MKTAAFVLSLLTLGLVFPRPAVAQRGSPRGSNESSSVAVNDKHPGTNFDFEDQLIRGKYEYPDEAVATVEDEKTLSDLLTVRKEFKDRLKEMSMRR